MVSIPVAAHGEAKALAAGSNKYQHLTVFVRSSAPWARREGNVWNHNRRATLGGDLWCSGCSQHSERRSNRREVNQAIADYYGSIPASGYTRGKVVRARLNSRTFEETIQIRSGNT